LAEHIRSVGWLLAFQPNMFLRLGWKWLAMTNTLAYNTNVVTAIEKSFIVPAPVSGNHTVENVSQSRTIRLPWP